MGKNQCFVASDASGDSELAPFTEVYLKSHIGEEAIRLKWYKLSPFHHYDPYLVHFKSRDDAKRELTFHFVDCDTGKPMLNLHTLSLDNWPLCYLANPSTIPRAEDIGLGKTYGFLMLNPQLLADQMNTDASNANTEVRTALGKWPGTATDALRDRVRSLETRNKELEALNRDLRQGARYLHDAISKNGLLPTLDRPAFENIGEMLK
jgi:hypothetical protein